VGVTGFDLPGVAEVFLAHAERRGLGDRVSAMAGDFNATAFPEGAFDRAVLANVVHLEPPESARDLVARVAAALRPGGDVVIVEPSHGGTPARDRAVAVYGLHLTMRTDRGQAYDLALLDELLRSAGLVPQEPVALGSAPGVLVAAIGRRPA
jgi:SAM-dependent methyltransferase